MAITDSGGVQEETTYLDIPCATLRENTERPITLTEGTNRLLKAADIPDGAREVLAGCWRKGSPPEYWDGPHCAARRGQSQAVSGGADGVTLGGCGANWIVSAARLGKGQSPLFP